MAVLMVAIGRDKSFMSTEHGKYQSYISELHHFVA